MSNGIFNASSVPLNKSNPALPNLSATLRGLFQRITLGIVSKVTKGFKTQETMTTVECLGVLIGNKVRLQITPTGQRYWKTKTLYTDRSVGARNDDVIQYDGTQYRVVEAEKNKGYGVFDYLLEEDYQNVGPTES